MALTPERKIQLKVNFAKAPVLLFLDEDLGSLDKLCFVVMGSFGSETRAGIEAIAKRMSVTPKTAKKARAILEKVGWIEMLPWTEGSPKHWKLHLTRVPSCLGGGVAGAEGGVNEAGEGVPGLPLKQIGEAANSKQRIQPKEEEPSSKEGEEAGARAKASPTPGEPQKKTERKKDQGQGTVEALEASPVGQAFQRAYLKATGLPYVFGKADAEALAQVPKLGLSQTRLEQAMEVFFAPDSWLVKQHVVRFKTFVNNAQAQALKAAPRNNGTEEELSRYYVPWDPRHPYFKPNDRVKIMQRLEWEAGNGPWTPPPDWTPGPPGPR